MKFIEAYKEIMEGKRVSKSDLNVTTQEGASAIKFMSMVTPSYVESATIIKQDAPFIAAFDVKGMIHRIGDQNAISMLLSEDDDWFEYVEPPIVSGSDLPELDVECVSEEDK